MKGSGRVKEFEGEWKGEGVWKGEGGCERGRGRGEGVKREGGEVGSVSGGVKRREGGDGVGGEEGSRDPLPNVVDCMVGQ